MRRPTYEAPTREYTHGPLPPCYGRYRHATPHNHHRPHRHPRTGRWSRWPAGGVDASWSIAENWTNHNQGEALSDRWDLGYKGKQPAAVAGKQAETRPRCLHPSAKSTSLGRGSPVRVGRSCSHRAARTMPRRLAPSPPRRRSLRSARLGWCSAAAAPRSRAQRQRRAVAARVRHRR
jgi:hypothetical protein